MNKYILKNIYNKLLLRPKLTRNSINAKICIGSKIHFVSNINVLLL